MSTSAVSAALQFDLPVWNCEENDILICRHVVQETHDVRTFFFSPPTPHIFRFEPGQFLTLQLKIGGHNLHRCYTISSPPTRPYTISITSKRVAGGPVSNWLHDHLRPGMSVQAAGPMGDFTSVQYPSEKYLFLSGGSGITPLMSMARTHADLAQDTDTIFVHAARSPDDIIFRDELERLAASFPHFRLAIICESDAPMRSWAGYRGRLSLALLREIAPDFAQREILTCGPSPFMASVRAILQEAGNDPTRYHQESFNFVELVDSLPEEAITAPLEGFEITFAKSARTIICGPETTILQAAKDAGLRLPSACARGMCGTCKSKMISGQVDMKHEGGIRQREIDQGMVLICCSKPLKDTVIDR
jgi:ferredoxin-NADP reductase